MHELFFSSKFRFNLSGPFFKFQFYFFYVNHFNSWQLKFEYLIMQSIEAQTGDPIGFQSIVDKPIYISFWFKSIFNQFYKHNSIISLWKIKIDRHYELYWKYITNIYQSIFDVNEKHWIPKFQKTKMKYSPSCSERSWISSWLIFGKRFAFHVILVWSLHFCFEKCLKFWNQFSDFRFFLWTFWKFGSMFLCFWFVFSDRIKEKLISNCRNLIILKIYEIFLHA